MKTDDPKYPDFVRIKFEIANIPDNVDDNSPFLYERLRVKFDEDFNTYKVTFARKSALRTKAKQNIIKGEGTNEGMEELIFFHVNNFTPKQISLLKDDFIEEKLNMLAKVGIMEFDVLDRIRIRRLRTFLEQEKAISVIKPKVPEWDQPLVALYYVYKGIRIDENNREAIAKSFEVRNSPQLIRGYNKYVKKANRIYSNLDNENEKGKANAQLKRLEKLVSNLEIKGEEVFENLKSDIEALKKNLRLK